MKGNAELAEQLQQAAEARPKGRGPVEAVAPPRQQAAGHAAAGRADKKTDATENLLTPG